MGEGIIGMKYFHLDPLEFGGYKFVKFMAVCLRKGEVEAKKKKRGGNETVVGNEYGGRELRPSRLIISKKDSYVSKKCFLIRNTHSITRHILRLIELNCPPTPCQILSLSPPTCP